MEALYDSQVEISDAMKKLQINLKKDSVDRKSEDYFKRRLELIDGYWVDYENNHKRICAYGNKEHNYFKNNEHEKTSELYNSIKALITEQSITLAAKKVPLSQNINISPTKRYQAEEHDQEKAGPSPRQVMVSRESTSKLDDMLRKQAANIKALKRAMSNITLESIDEKWELEDALKTLNSKWKQVDGLHWEIDGEMCGVDERYDLIYNENEKAYMCMKRDISKKLWSTSHREQSTPQMDIPVFTGKYQQWYSFKDLFNETIHSNVSLSNAQKMQFLKGKLRGEAEKIIQHLPISSENYNTCWELLNHRYNNKKLIFTSIINTLLGLPSMQQQSSIQIKKLHDVTLESIHAIRNLGVDVTTWDPLLVHLLAQKLDGETYGDYVQSLKNARELPVLQEFLDFIEMKFTSLESSRRKQENSTQKTTPNIKQIGMKAHSSYDNQHSNNNSRSFSKSLHVSSTVKCLFCGQQHGLYHCNKFLNMTNESKLKTIAKLNVCKNCLFDHNGQQCISTKRCRKCDGMHNSILHDAFSKTRSLPASNAVKTDLNANEENASMPKSAQVSVNAMKSEVMLATALIKVEAVDGTYQILRAMIDPGSQVSIIKECAVKKLGLQKSRCNGVVVGVGEQQNKCKGKLTIHCSSTCNNFSFSTDVIVMDSLLGNLPTKSFVRPNWSHVENLKLADPEYYNSNPIDLLLSADVYGIILLSGLIKGENPSQPVAQQTQLGWIICGGGEMTSYRCNVVLNNIEDIQRFWEIEDITEDSNMSSEDQECVDYYLATTKRRADGRYEVRLPLKSNINEKLGSSKGLAIAQLQSLERKFTKQPELAEQYKSFMREYLALGHMVHNQNNNNETRSCYLPHHAVQRAESATTKLRVVFNASARTSSGYSINDLMFKGPNLQQDLLELIIKWRQYRYAFTADIEKMYRQIMVNETDQQYQQIVWRDSPNEPIKSYKLACVTYGSRPAPFLALMTLRQLAIDEKHHYPQASKALTESFFVDDYIDGSHCIPSGKLLISDLIKLLQSAGFNLRKWSANHPELLMTVKHNMSHDHGNVNFNFKTENTSKTLGLCWNSVNDEFHFKYQLEKQHPKLTKRILLGEISRLFDPLGWLTPVSTKLKLLFQKLWLDNLSWDQEVPNNISQEWNTVRTNMPHINQCTIPRWIGYQPNDVIELHGYCDASTKAYAAVIYARIKRQNETSVILLVAKSRLVPIAKSISLPRLELSGAHLLSRLMKKAISCLGEHEIRVFGWSDSMVVLGWLQGDPGRWKPFVANRTRSITEIIKPSCWLYIKSEDNPADAASRGIMASELKNHPLWWNGPKSLNSFDERLALSKQTGFTTDQELKVKCSQGQQSAAITQKPDTESIIMKLLEKYSSLTKVTKIIAWLLRTIKIIRFTKNAASAKHRTLPSYITLRELHNAKLLLIKHIQRTMFYNDYEHLKRHGKLYSKSNLLKLYPFIDREGVIRVGGRLGKATMRMEMKHPAIIPHSSRLTTLIIDQAHQLTYHGGPRLTLANIRQKYWIVGGNNAVKKMLRNCVICRKHTPKLQQQLMSDLPEARSNPAPPFYHTGVDYTGYVEVKSNKGRGVRTTKGYIALFVCMVTRAIHLELVSDLSSSAFIAALRRMAARRGAPRHIYSDNGTNFVGANRILQEQFLDLQRMFDDKVFTELTDLNIQWHFNAPSWPSAGGLWERAVRSLKHHLRRVVGEQKLTFEEYATILAQVESCLNSRPLCALSEDIDDLDVLTPAHFLQGRPGTTIIETEHDARTRWTLTAKISQDIWHKWKSEYLTLLSTRSKWVKIQDNIKVGQLVTVHDDNLPPGKWMMGRVVELHPGQDGLVRVVSLKTRNGIIKRPIVKLAILPIPPGNNDEPESKTINSAEEPTRLSKNPRSTFASIAFALFFFLSLATTSQATISISALPNNMSLYFDPVDNLQLIRDKWTLIVYYNMSPYWDGMTAATKFVNYLEKSCGQLPDKGRCKMITSQLQHEYSEIQHYNKLLLNQHFDAHPRQRRGLINGVGYVANTLFGVLDESFAEKYRQDIQHLKQNDNYLASLIKNQTSVVESEYNILKRTEQNIQVQHKAINKHLNELEQATYIVKQNIESLNELQDFTLIAITTINLFQNIKAIQDTLLDTITDISHGKFNSHLLTPDQLTNELQFISGQLTKDITLPINNIQSDLKSVYSMLRVKARVMKDYVIFEITFPLSSRDNYKLYKILSVPHQVGKAMLSVTPVSEYVAINLQKDTYLTVSFMELQFCLRHETSYLCAIDKPLNYLPIDEKFCKINQTTNQCVINKSQCLDKWIKLNDPSKYFYFCCNSYAIRIICQEQITYKQVSAAGVISLQPKCIIKGKNFALYSRSRSENAIKADPEIDIPQITELNHLVNISLSHYTEPVDTTTNDDGDIENQISQLKTASANAPNSLDFNISTHDVHQYVICYGLLGAAVTVAAVFLWRRRGASPRDPNQTEVPTVKFSRKQSTADRQPSEVNVAVVASTYSLNSTQDMATSPIPQKRSIYTGDFD